MSVQVKHRRDSAANIAAFTPAQGELIVDTTNTRVIVGDGATVGGFAAAKLSEVVAASQIGAPGGVAGLDAGGHLPPAQAPAYSGDASAAAGSTALTLASVNAAPGSFGGAASVPVVTVNAKGLVTGVSSAAIAISSSAVSGLAASATTDATNAANISSGTLASARLAAASRAARTAVADANYAAQLSDRQIAFTSLTAARVVTLPAASAFPSGATLAVIDESGACSATNAITLARAGTDTLNGGASYALNGAYMSVTLESDGVSKWTILGNATADAFGYAGFATAPDPNNVISAYGASALFNGTSFSFTVNKSAVGNTASVLFQDGFSARAQIGLLGDDNLSFKVSPNGATYATGLTLDKTTGAVTLGNARTAIADANYAALPSDREIAFTAISAPRTVTLPAASAFPAGHPLVIADESGAVSAVNTLAIVRSGSDTIGAQTSATISSPYGYCRLFSNGVNAWTVSGRSLNVQVFSASGTYTPSPGMTKCDVYIVGGGGGGGGGCLQAASIACSGGGGGGGAAGNFGTFTAAQVGASKAVTIAAGGVGGAASTTNTTAGGTGGQGGLTSFGSLLKAYGGGGGGGGSITTSGTGGGGGGSTTAAGNNGGSNGAAGAGSSGSGNGGAGTTSSNTNVVQVGGGGGGGTYNGPGNYAGYIMSGASGGGSGAGLSTAGAVYAGGNGGVVTFLGLTAAPGGAAGANGSTGSTATGVVFNSIAGGGGGGGGSSLTAAGSGGAGVNGGGGGGGGSAQNGGAPGAGGPGGAGYCLIVEYF